MLAINENTTVRELLSVHPHAAEVLLRHGMCEDCKADPPPVPLHHFASKHCGGNIAGLIRELKRAVAKS